MRESHLMGYDFMVTLLNHEASFISPTLLYQIEVSKGTS